MDPQLGAAQCRKSVRTLVGVIGAVAVGGTTLALAVPAQAKPAPEVEYLYNVMTARRQNFNFPGPTEALNYGYGICDKVSRGDGYAQVLGDVKNEVAAGNEFTANYLISYAVEYLCPAQLWQLRNSAANYRPPSDGT